MRMRRCRKSYKPLGRFLLSLLFLILIPAMAGAQQAVSLNVLAVNGTESRLEKDVEVHLPPEVKLEDILETSGLKVQFDSGTGTYMVYDKVLLEPKQSKTFKVRIRDVWQITPDSMNEVRKQIEESFGRLEGTKYLEVGRVRKDELHRRLDFIQAEQERFSDNVQQRINAYRTYSKEYNSIRDKAVSISYWRTEPPAGADSALLTFSMSFENPTDSQVTISPRHYLPSEVKPEHLVNYEGFDLGFDPIRGQFYFTREITLAPKENKKFQIGIIDVWNIDQVEIENLRNRSRDAYRLLESSIYSNSALYLIKNIKEQLDAVDASQAVDREVAEHISEYKLNIERFEQAKKDVAALEDLLTALREELERSRLKNILQKITQLKSLADIADAIFGNRPVPNNAWKIITGIMVFVGLFTFLHFAVWGKRSKDAKLKTLRKDKEEATK